MANRSINNKDEPSTAPESDRWYDLTLGSSLKDSHSATKFCTLRYEFKPASIDNNQSGSLHNNTENRVTVEYHNNKPGKPKVTFEGSSEDYKENDAVLFFDGETFRLERLQRAVKRLRHVRLPGESASAAASTAAASTAAAPSMAPPVESYSPPFGKGAKHQSFNKSSTHPVTVEVERIDIGNSESLGTKAKNGKVTDYPTCRPNPSMASPNPKSYELEEHLDIVNDDNDSFQTAKKRNVAEREFHNSIDINLPNQNDMDDEIARVDVSDDEAENGPNAAEALRAQVDAEGREEKTSSSSGSSGSESSGTGSGSGSGSGTGSGSGSGSGSGRRSTSSDTESSDADSVNSI